MLAAFADFFCCASSLDLAMEASPKNTLPCCRCKVVKEKVVQKQSGTGTSTHLQVICCECNALNSRINRMLKGLTDEQNEGYKEMTPECREDFLKKATGLCGPDLKKILEEAITWSETHRRTQLMKYEGDLLPLDEVETNMKDKPDQLAILKQRAPQVQHQFTGQDMIWVPKLSLKDETEFTSTQERKRTLSSEQKVKATKGTKVAKVEKEKTPEGKPSMAPVPEAQITKLGKVAEAMEASLVKVACHSFPFWTQ